MIADSAPHFEHVGEHAKLLKQKHLTHFTGVRPPPPAPAHSLSTQTGPQFVRATADLPSPSGIAESLLGLHVLDLGRFQLDFVSVRLQHVIPPSAFFATMPVYVFPPAVTILLAY